MQTKLKTKLNSNAQAVLDSVQGTQNHPTALEIYEAVKRVRPHSRRLGAARSAIAMMGMSHAMTMPSARIVEHCLMYLSKSMYRRKS